MADRRIPFNKRCLTGNEMLYVANAKISSSHGSKAVLPHSGDAVER